MIPTAQPVILAGGYGTRLWLLSRSLLQEEVSRTLRLKNVRAPVGGGAATRCSRGTPPGEDDVVRFDDRHNRKQCEFSGLDQGLNVHSLNTRLRLKSFVVQRVSMCPFKD